MAVDTLLYGMDETLIKLTTLINNQPQFSSSIVKHLSC